MMELVLAVAGPVSGAILTAVGLRVNHSITRVAALREKHEAAIEQRFERLASIVGDTQSQFTAAQKDSAIAMAKFSTGLDTLAATVEKAAEMAAAERRDVFTRLGLLEQSSARHGALLASLSGQVPVVPLGINGAMRRRDDQPDT